MEGSQRSQEQRIAERRQRIQKRMSPQGLRRGSRLSAGSHADGDDDDTSTMVAADLKAREAQRTIAAVRSEAANAVTQFAAKADADEVDRRDREEDLGESRGRRLEAVAQETDALGGAVGLGFEALYAIGVPHDLRDALEEQRSQCAAIMTAKEHLVEELQVQLGEKEEEYVRLLRQNAQDINGLVEAMTVKTEEFLDNYGRQLGEVEREYEQERRELVERCDGEIHALIKTRRTTETDHRKRREAKIAEAQQRLEDKHENSYEDYNATKRGHLEDISTLQQELEKCKADFLLNGERLSYNLQVLRERVKENKSAQNQYKRKLAKLQDTLSTLVARHQDSEKRYQRANKDLTSQLHRAVGQYKDAQEKFQLFEKADKDKYRQLWNMHDQRCQRLVHRSLQADRVVFEDVLHMPWSPPDLSFWPDDEQQGDADGLEEGDDEEAPQEDEIELGEPAMMLLHILRDQAPFLVHQRVRDAIKAIEGTTEEQADVEGILTTLSIRRNDDVRDMLEYFIVENDDDAAIALINPQEALRALNAFLEDRRNAEREAATARAAKGATAVGAGAGASKGVAAATKRQQQWGRVEKAKEVRRAKQEKEYWEKLSTCVPREHLQVWEALEKGLEKYLAQLQQRKNLISQTDTLRAQNDELKGLLGEYLHRNINYELYATPALVTSMLNKQ